MSGLYLARDTSSLLFRNKSHCEMEPSLSIVTRDSPPCDLAPSRRGKQPRAIKLRVIPEDDRFLRNAKAQAYILREIYENRPTTCPISKDETSIVEYSPTKVRRVGLFHGEIYKSVVSPILREVSRYIFIARRNVAAVNLTRAN